MSNPVSSMDVEDVLSSIRRLVSEEAKGSSESGESDAGESQENIHEAAENAVSDALADLTRKQGETGEPEATDQPPLVVGGESDDATLVTGGNGEAAPQVPFRHQAAAAARRTDAQKLMLTAALRVAETALDEPSEPTEPETLEADLVLDDTPVADAEDRAEAEAEVASDALVVPMANPKAEHTHLRPVADSEPPSESSDSVVQSGIRPKRFNYAPEDTLFERAKRAMEAVKDKSVVPPVAAPVEPPVVSETPDPVIAKDAPLEVQQEPVLDAPEISQQPQLDTSPFSDGGRVFSTSEVENAEVENASAPEPEVVTEAPAGETELEPSIINFAEEESILDEDTLRDLVADMVREELQGELGDRITRNVRKLVRREIQRTIASREFE